MIEDATNLIAGERTRWRHNSVGLKDTFFLRVLQAGRAGTAVNEGWQLFLLRTQLVYRSCQLQS